MTETNVKLLEEKKERELIHAKVILGKVLERSTIGKNCKNCHGRGHVGYNVLLKDYVLCLCLRRKKRISENDIGIKIAMMEKASNKIS